MQINISFDKEFDEIWDILQKKYPKKLFDLDGVGKQLDFSEFTKNFFSIKGVTADKSVDSNSNVEDSSVVAYHSEVMKPLKRLNSYYMLWKGMRKYFNTKLADEVLEMQLCGDIYINDYHDFFIKSYCFNYSTYDVMSQGLPYMKKINCVPPKYLLTFKQQLEQFTVFASNNQSGAAGQADLLIIMSYYIKKALDTKSDCHINLGTEENVWQYVKEILTSYIYTINQPFKTAESPFTNVSIYDNYFLKDMCEEIFFPDGSQPNIEIIQKTQKIFLEIMNEEFKRTLLTFPVVTACFSIDDDENIKDLNFLEFISKENKKWGYINIYAGMSSTLASCCRLRSENNNEYFNSFGAGSSKIGSLGVVTLNIARCGRTCKTEDELLDRIRYLTEIACKINKVKRNILLQRIDEGSLPLYKLGYMDISKQYLTTGVNGLNECLYFMNQDVLEEEGQNLQLKIINTINDVNITYSKRYQCPINCEQTPSENSAIKLASKDKLLKIQNEFDLYSNQFIPLTTNADLLDRILLQGKFDKHFSGGAICHLNLENIVESKDIYDLVLSSVKKGVVYFAINYNIQKCINEHMSVGKTNKCAICNEKIIDNFLRVVGFITNTKNWHKTRREIDYPNRQFYKTL